MLFRNRLGTVLPYMYAAPDIATCMYYAGIDPFTKQEVYVAKVERKTKGSS